MVNNLIQEKDIRIGNYIYDRHGEIYQVNHNTFRDFAAPKIDCNYGYTGIPITEDTLREIGFDNEIEGVEDEDGNFIPIEDIGDVDFLIFGNGSNISVEIIPDELGLKNTYAIHISQDMVNTNGDYCSQCCYTLEYDTLYLHDLQNVNAVLTGTELAFDL